jgi:hypothetical protein
MAPAGLQKKNASQHRVIRFIFFVFNYFLVNFSIVLAMVIGIKAMS